MSGTGGRTPEDAKGEDRPTPTPRRARARTGRKAPTATELRAALAERERQLRDLTEQSLDLLDRLAEAQRRDAEHRATAQRAEQLARQLVDARRRLRTAGSVVLRAGAGGSPPATVDVVLWGGDTASVRARLDAMSPSTSVTWVGRAQALPDWAGRDDKVHWITADDVRTPAQCWNLAMASTQADTVLFLGAEASLAGAAELPSFAADPSVAIAQPLCARGGNLWRGLVSERQGAWDMAGFAPIAHDPADPGPTEIAFADPAAFLVRRSAFETVGMFDEALLGRLALVDFTLRAQARGYRALGLPTPRVELAAGRTPDPHATRDRLFVLASHRATALGPALANDETLWELSPDAVAPFVADLFARLPSEDATAGTIVAILGSMVAHAAPASKVIAALHDLLTTQVEIWTSPPLADAAAELAELTTRVDATPPGSIVDALAALDAVLAFERRWMPDVGEAQVEATRQHAEAVRRAEQLERQLGESRRDVELHQEGLKLIAHAIDMVGHFEPARIRERLLDLRRDAEHLASLLDAAGAPSPTALIQELYAIRNQLATGRDAIVERDAQLAANRRELRERDALVAERDRRLSELTRALADREAERSALALLVEERSRWIVALLGEVGKRRLIPRPLLEHEVAFLAEQAKTP